MESQTTEKHDLPEGEGEGTPVCLRCFRPVDPLAHYCPHCGGATGRFTHYLPFISIRWEASVWGQAWRQMWSREISLRGRLFRFVMIAWNVPIMLIGLLFRPPREAEEKPDERDTSSDPER